MRRLPSARSIVWTDEIALIAAILPIVSVVLGVVAGAGLLPDRHGGGFVPAEHASIFYAIAALGLVAGVAIIGWRVGKIRAAFAIGREVPGRIVKITAFKDRAYVRYEYQVGSRTITARHFVHQTKAMKALREGQAVTIVVNARSPGDGFVLELFG